jgi:ABC-type branched-subunit amino acid transport system ATPase component
MNDIDGSWVLRARGLRKQYGRDAGLVRAVDGVDLDVAPGETVAVMGPAGAGSRRCCTCSAGWTGPRPGKSGWPGSAPTGSPNGRWPGCGVTLSASCSKPFT